MATSAIKIEDRSPSGGTFHREEVDLKSYFQRIGYTGATEPSLAVLKKIHLLHTQTIPFENLNPLLRIPVLLDLQSLQKKLIAERRGGYCFEQNHLLGAVLKALGFTVKGLAARVLWNTPEDVITPRGHMLLLVEVDEELFIADVGFGGMTLTSPLRLITDLEQTTPHENFRLLQDPETYILQAKIREDWKPVYRFSLEEQFLPDYEVSSWYLSNHPKSHFITSLIAARTTSGARYSLRNNELAIHTAGSTERSMIQDGDALKNVLQNTFLITLPDHPDLARTLSHIAEGKSVV